MAAIFAYFYGPNGEAEIFHDDADIPKGWLDHPYNPENPACTQPKPAEPADDEAVDPRKELRAQYEAVMGKRAFSGWDAETLQAKIAAKLAENG